MGNRPKMKKFNGTLTCKDGEEYTFKHGKAVVPGFLMNHRTVKITYKEFKEMNNGD